MALGSPKRMRVDRATSVVVPPGLVGRFVVYLRRDDVLMRLALCLVAAAIMWAITGAWAPPFAYRAGYTPPRNVVARVDFEVPDAQRTADRQNQARRNIRCVYSNDTRPLQQLRQGVENTVAQIARSELYDAETWRGFWDEHSSDDHSEVTEDREAQFEKFRDALKGEKRLVAFDAAIDTVFREMEQTGLLEQIHSLDEGSQTHVEVHPLGDEADRRTVKVDEILISKVVPNLKLRLQIELTPVIPDAATRAIVVARVSDWISRQLPTTLTLNESATEKVRDAKVQEVREVMLPFKKGQVLAKGGVPLRAGGRELELLRAEHVAFVAAMPFMQRLFHAIADLGMFAAIFTLCGFYIFYRERHILEDFRHFFTVLATVVVVVILSWFATNDRWRIEIIPMLLLGWTLCIAYRQEVALLLTAVVSLMLVLSLGEGIAEFVVLVATTSAGIQLLGRIRSRTKLLAVGAATAVAGMLTSVGIGVLMGQPMLATLLPASLWLGFCTLLAAMLMTGLLPFVEQLFGVQTELSLLELGDAAHPLLQELIRRAPGTYNHSINVASIAESAAEAIGANGLLVRVGAYFHDIGKMLKPGYFIENQGDTGNRHEALLPAMSTLVIISHVKDGIDLARQHGLPESLIDFIEQHHGTTLVEFFYHQANQKSQEDPEAAKVEESHYRYPGPKPQTKETAVMMLADIVESASRTLVDPAPARIKSCVHDLVMKRLLEGQLDECGLTLAELKIIETNLAKSIIAVYHGRVKYPDRQDGEEPSSRSSSKA